MRASLLVFSAAVVGSTAIADSSGANAQSRSLPRGSSLAATPPIDRRNKQFRALTPAQRKSYLQQGYQPQKHPN